MTGKQIHHKPESAHDAHLERDVYIPIRDGDRLATDISFAAAERRPARGSRYFASRGYVPQFQNTRRQFNFQETDLATARPLPLNNGE